jgi:3,4-dihydroxy 2-butanone 4-phosphate synthase/GTP cyclohydrolase II
MSAPFSTIEEALKDFKRGKFVLVTDDASRENEGDLIMAAQFVDAPAINFMARNARGLICVPMEGERLQELGLGLMSMRNTERHSTAFTMSVDAHPRFGVTTGISASDRAKAVQILINPRHVPAI